MIGYRAVEIAGIPVNDAGRPPVTEPPDTVIDCRAYEPPVTSLAGDEVEPGSVVQSPR